MSTKHQYSLTARIAGDFICALMVSTVAFAFGMLIRFFLTHTPDPWWYVWLNFFSVSMVLALVIDRWDNGPFRPKKRETPP